MNRVHPRLTRRTCWLDHPGNLPTIEGTLIRLQVEHLPGDRHPKPVWLWMSAIDTTSTDIDRAWQTYLRRFDLEHTFRFLKQTLGWTRPHAARPRLRRPLDLARHRRPHPTPPRQRLTTDLRRPWEKPAPPGRLTPTRVRRGFRNIHRTITQPARAQKPSKAGPGRPPGSPTATAHPSATWEKPSNAQKPSPHTNTPKVKQQA